jgi:hypothetical protein
MNMSYITIRLSTTDAKKLVGMLGDFIFIVEQFPRARDALMDFPEYIDKDKRVDDPMYFMRRLQNSIVRASKKIGARWARGLPVNELDRKAS